MEPKEGDIVICTVKKIEKTMVFLEIEGNGEGSMVLSEVAAGRIRNLRQYVAPNKKVVCKILSIIKDHINLSLRRVTGKERDEIIDRYKKERKISNMLKTVTKNSKQIIIKIKQDHDLGDFIEEARENPKLLSKYFTKEEINKIEKILAEKIEKEKKVKKIFKLTTNNSAGIKDIKEILSINTENTDIRYHGSSKFSITTKAKDFKEANKNLPEILEVIEKKAKQKNAQIEIK